MSGDTIVDTDMVRQRIAVNTCYRAAACVGSLGWAVGTADDERFITIHKQPVGITAGACPINKRFRYRASTAELTL